VDEANFAGRRSLEPSVSAACRLSDGPLTRTTDIASCIYTFWLIFIAITLYPPLFSVRSAAAGVGSRSQAAGGRQSPDSLKSQLNSEVAAVPDSVASGWRCGNAMLKEDKLSGRAIWVTSLGVGKLKSSCLLVR
jgi:hypothetical protein